MPSSNFCAHSQVMTYSGWCKPRNRKPVVRYLCRRPHSFLMSTGQIGRTPCSPSGNPDRELISPRIIGQRNQEKPFLSPALRPANHHTALPCSRATAFSASRTATFLRLTDIFLVSFGAHPSGQNG